MSALPAAICTQGDPPKLFVVESGRVEGTFRKLGSKVDHPLACFGKGQVMGEVTMIGALPPNPDPNPKSNPNSNPNPDPNPRNPNPHPNPNPSPNTATAYAHARAYDQAAG